MELACRQDGFAELHASGIAPFSMICRTFSIVGPIAYAAKLDTEIKARPATQAAARNHRIGDWNCLIAELRGPKNAM